MRYERPVFPGFALVMVVMGIGIALAAALQPYFDAAYRIDVPTLAAGLAPYLIFGVLAVLVPDRTALGAGGAVLSVHALIGVHQRFLTDGYREGDLLVVIPLVLAGLLLALAPWARGSLDFPSDGRTRTATTEEHSGDKTEQATSGAADRSA